MNNSTARADEQTSFERAVKQFTAQPKSSEPMIAMMRLATQAVSPTLKRWAGEWLFRNCNIRIIFDEKVEGRHATPRSAANLR